MDEAVPRLLCTDGHSRGAIAESYNGPQFHTRKLHVLNAQSIGFRSSSPLKMERRGGNRIPDACGHLDFSGVSRHLRLQRRLEPGLVFSEENRNGIVQEAGNAGCARGFTGTGLFSQTTGETRVSGRESLPPRVVEAQRFLARRGWPGRRAVAERQAIHSAALTGLIQSPATSTWQPLGPTAVISANYGLVTGRVSSIAFDPADPTGNRVYLGTTGGGVWLAQNAGTSNAASVVFTPLTDAVAALSTAPDASISIGAITVQPGGTGVILAGTGDPNDALDSYYGAGILRSTDGGNSWNLIALTSDQLLAFAGEGFAGFAWSTSNPQLVVAAVSEAYEGTLANAERPNVSYAGLYYSTDSGATWSLARITDQSGFDVQGPGDLFALPNGNAATSVIWNPVRRVFVAAVRFHGYYQSTDGMSWTRLVAQPGTGLTNWPCALNSSSAVGDVPVHSASFLGGIHRHAAFQMPLARLVVLVEVHRCRGRRQTPTRRRGQRKAVRRVQAHRRTVVAKYDPRINRIGLAVPVLQHGRAQQAQARAAVEFSVLRTDVYLVLAAIGRQLHRLHQRQEAAFGVERCPHRAPASLCHGEIHAFGRRHHAAVPVEGHAAGLHFNLAGFAGHTLRRMRMIGRLAVAGRRRRPRQQHLHRSRGRGHAALLVVFELVALDPVDFATYRRSIGGLHCPNWCVGRLG